MMNTSFSSTAEEETIPGLLKPATQGSKQLAPISTSSTTGPVEKTPSPTNSDDSGHSQKTIPLTSQKQNEFTVNPTEMTETDKIRKTAQVNTSAFMPFSSDTNVIPPSENFPNSSSSTPTPQSGPQYSSIYIPNYNHMSSEGYIFMLQKLLQQSLYYQMAAKVNPSLCAFVKYNFPMFPIVMFTQLVSESPFNPTQEQLAEIFLVTANQFRELISNGIILDPTRIDALHMELSRVFYHIVYANTAGQTGAAVQHGQSLNDSNDSSQSMNQNFHSPAPQKQQAPPARLSLFHRNLPPATPAAFPVTRDSTYTNKTVSASGMEMIRNLSHGGFPQHQPAAAPAEAPFDPPLSTLPPSETRAIEMGLERMEKFMVKEKLHKALKICEEPHIDPQVDRLACLQLLEHLGRIPRDKFVDMQKVDASWLLDSFTYNRIRREQSYTTNTCSFMPSKPIDEMKTPDVIEWLRTYCWADILSVVSAVDVFKAMFQMYVSQPLHPLFMSGGLRGFIELFTDELFSLYAPSAELTAAISLIIRECFPQELRSRLQNEFFPKNLRGQPVEFSTMITSLDLSVRTCGENAITNNALKTRTNTSIGPTLWSTYFPTKSKLGQGGYREGKDGNGGANQGGGKQKEAKSSSDRNVSSTKSGDTTISKTIPTNKKPTSEVEMSYEWIDKNVRPTGCPRDKMPNTFISTITSINTIPKSDLVVYLQRTQDRQCVGCGATWEKNHDCEQRNIKKVALFNDMNSFMWRKWKTGTASKGKVNASEASLSVPGSNAGEFTSEPIATPTCVPTILPNSKTHPKWMKRCPTHPQAILFPKLASNSNSEGYLVPVLFDVGCFENLLDENPDKAFDQSNRVVDGIVSPALLQKLHCDKSLWSALPFPITFNGISTTAKTPPCVCTQMINVSLAILTVDPTHVESILTTYDVRLLVVPSLTVSHILMGRYWQGDKNFDWKLARCLSPKSTLVDSISKDSLFVSQCSLEHADNIFHSFSEFTTSELKQARKLDDFDHQSDFFTIPTDSPPAPKPRLPDSEISKKEGESSCQKGLMLPKFFPLAPEDQMNEQITDFINQLLPVLGSDVETMTPEDQEHFSFMVGKHEPMLKNYPEVFEKVKRVLMHCNRCRDKATLGDNYINLPEFVLEADAEILKSIRSQSHRGGKDPNAQAYVDSWVAHHVESGDFIQLDTPPNHAPSLHVIPKKSNTGSSTFRVVAMLNKVNAAVLEQPHHSRPTRDLASDMINIGRNDPNDPVVVFSTDHIDHFHRIPVKDPHKLTAFRSKTKAYAMGILPQGLKTSTAISSASNEVMFEDILDQHLFAVVDNIALVCRMSQYPYFLALLIHRAEKHNAIWKRKETVFSMNDLFLGGFQINFQTRSFTKGRKYFEVLCNTELPTNGPQLAFHIYLARYTSDVVPNLAAHTVELSKMIPTVRAASDHAKLRAVVFSEKDWTPARVDAFQRLRVALRNHVSITCLQPNHTVEISVDASLEAVGGIVYQFPTSEASLPLEQRHCSILSVTSHCNSTVEARESPRIRELRGILRSANAAAPLIVLAPRPVIAYNDHQTNEIGLDTEPLSVITQQVAWRMFATLDTMGIQPRYRKGVEMSFIEDFLSRPKQFGIPPNACPEVDAPDVFVRGGNPTATPPNSNVHASAGMMTRSKTREMVTKPLAVQTSKPTAPPVTFSIPNSVPSMVSVATSAPTEPTVPSETNSKAKKKTLTLRRARAVHAVNPTSISPTETSEVRLTMSRLMEIASESTPTTPISPGDKLHDGLWWTTNNEGVEVIHLGVADSALLVAIMAFHHNGPRGHPGINNTLSLIKQSWKWNAMDDMIRKFVDLCLSCKMFKGPNKMPVPLGTLPKAFRPFSVICFDFFAMEPSEDGYNCILLIADVFSKLVNLFPCLDRKEATVLKCFADWVSHYPVPFQLICDQDPVFVSQLTTKLLASMLVDVNYSHAYVKQSNGYAEVAGKTMGKMFRQVLADLRVHIRKWDEAVPIIQAGLNSIPRSRHVYGSSANNVAFSFPSDSSVRVRYLKDRDACEIISMSVREAEHYHECHESLSILNHWVDGKPVEETKALRKGFPNFPVLDGQFVMIMADVQKGSLKARFDKLGQVVRRFNDWSYQVRDVFSKQETVYHAQWLRPLDSSFRLSPEDESLIGWVQAQQNGVEAVIELRFNPSAKTQTPAQLQARMRWTDATRVPSWVNVKEWCTKLPLLFQDMLARMDEDNIHHASLITLLK